MSEAVGEIFASALAASQTAGTRKRHGRAYRRRRQKLLEIEQAEETMLQQLLKNAQQSAATIVSSSEVTRTLDDRERELGLNHRQQQNNSNMIPQELSDRDKACLMAQLGYIPGNVLRVTCRLGELNLPGLCLSDDNKQEPVAIQLYPLATRRATTDTRSAGKGTRKPRTRKRHVSELASVLTNDDGADDTACDDKADDIVLEPFPTMFWMTHPLLRVMISKLEVSGMGSQIEKRLVTEEKGDICKRHAQETAAAADDDGTTAEAAHSNPLPYLDHMKTAHATYGQERFGLLIADDIQLLQDRGWTAALDASRGVAGIVSPKAVKCLHAHVAHYVSRPEDKNIVGEWVMQEITSVLRRKQEGETRQQVKLADGADPPTV